MYQTDTFTSDHRECSETGAHFYCRDRLWGDVGIESKGKV